MGDEQRGPPLTQVGNGPHHRGFRAAVQRRGRLVQDQQRGTGEEGRGDRDPLPFPARQPGAAFAKGRVDPIRQTGHHVEGTSPMQDVEQHGVLGVRPGEEQMIPDGGSEQVNILRDHRDPVPMVGQLDGGDVLAIHQHPALVRVVPALQQVHQSRLARTRASDQGQRLTRSDVEVDVDQCRRGRPRVGEGHPLEADRRTAQTCQTR